MSGTDAMREQIAQDIARVAGCQVGSERTRKLVDYVLALLATDRAAGVGEAQRLRDFADKVQNAAVDCCIDPDAGPEGLTSVSFTGDEGAKIAYLLHQFLDAYLAACPPAPADASGEVLRSAIMAEVVEGGRWSLRFDFGKGDAACLSMREASDAIRKLTGAN